LLRRPEMKTNSSKDRIVYSTEQGRICPGCSSPVKQCTCRKQTSPIGDGRVRVSRETKGRKGKGVTLIKGLAMDADTLALMGKKLKAMCGAGGTVKEGVIEVQGDHIERILDYLQKQGIRAKRSGG
jgi:translation initiation factor 1